MLKISTIILLISLSGCATIPKTFTNEECIKIVCSEDHCDTYSRSDRALVEMGLYLECSKNDNDPYKTIESLRNRKS